MNGHVLLLNQDYSALTLCTVRRAVVLMLLDKVELVDAVSDQYVRSPSRRVPWPSIVRLKDYASVPYKRVMLTRRNVLQRDGHECQYCGSKSHLTVDHVHPKSRGGRDTWENLVAACVRCNNRKGDRTPSEADMSLKRKPFRPSYVMFIRDRVDDMREAWKPYLFLS
jgi:5-methylcytosine-specific restriction endonuclease McrA